MIMKALKTYIYSSGDLNLRQDGTNRFVPWVLAPISLFALGLIMAWQLLANWQSFLQAQLGGDLSVLWIFPPQAAGLDQSAAALPPDLTSPDSPFMDILAAMRAHPQVLELSLVPPAELRTYLSQWVDTELLSTQDILPLLTDITLRENNEDITALRQEITALATSYGGEVEIIHHTQWVQSWRRNLDRMHHMVIGLLGVMFLSLCGAVAFITRAALASHRQTIELLYTMGATSGYISRQIEGHTVGLVVMGSLLGGGLASVLLWFWHRTGIDAEQSMAGFAVLQSEGNGFDIGWALAIGLAGMVLISALIAWVTTRVTVRAQMRHFDS